jgi:hypothetical protein
MVNSPLASLLLGSRAAAPEKLEEAQRRRAIYGGTLDTVLLEMGAVDERVMAAHLAEAAGLPTPLPERLAAPDLAARDALSPADAQRLRVVPLGRDDGQLELVLHPDADAAAVAAWAQAAGVAVTAFVVPEVRYRELLAVVYGAQIPPRFCVLLGRLMGSARARERARAKAPVVAPPVVDTGPLLTRPPPPREPEPEIDVEVEPPPPKGPTPEELAAAKAARERELEAHLAALSSARAAPDITRAIAALVERREPRAVPGLIDRLGAERAVSQAAQAALVTLTRQDFGDSRRLWLGWWQKARARHRMEWLLEALGHKRGDLRLAASEELQAATGVYFGYHFDLPERDREEARRRWTEWWQTVGKAQAARGP